MSQLRSGRESPPLWPLAAIALVIAAAGILVWLVWRSPHRGDLSTFRGFGRPADGHGPGAVLHRLGPQAALVSAAAQPLIWPGRGPGTARRRRCAPCWPPWPPPSP